VEAGILSAAPSDPPPLRGCPPTSQEGCKISVFSIFVDVFRSLRVVKKCFGGLKATKNMLFTTKNN
jgi:hypothetical protein